MMTEAPTYRIKARKGDPQRTIRFPDEIINLLLKIAYKNGRSINTEVVYRVARGLNLPVHQDKLLQR